MTYPLGSAEVAEDYQKALEDLSMNTRVEISNLTVIAQENIEHALAISETLKNHIRTTSPQKKLPALYVLDSIVKNVGTPYTIFFGRQLFNTFMQAYAIVDNNVRRKLDEMLKTWKEPVPGSIESRPVFPPDITRPIENALIKARTSALQAEQARNQQMARARPGNPQVMYPQTATPPVMHTAFNTPPSQPTSYPSPYPQYPPSTPVPGQNFPQSPYLTGQQYPAPPTQSSFTPQPYPNGQQQYPQSQQYNGYSNGAGAYPTPQQPHPSPYVQQDTTPWYPPQQSHNTAQYPAYRTPEPSIDSLSNDIAGLILESKQDFARNPMDSSIQTRLKALLDLQSILQSQALPRDQIELVRSQVAQLSKAARPSVAPRHSITPLSMPPTPTAIAQHVVQQPNLTSLLRSNAIAELLAKSSGTPTPTPPPPVVGAVRPPVTQQQPETSYQTIPAIAAPKPAAVASDTNSLLARLKASGLLSAAAVSPRTSISQSTNAATASTVFPLPQRNALAEIPNDVTFKPHSLKMPRPHLIASLFENLGTPCSQCGRRFLSDEAGRKRRTAHMDWHFRMHQRLNDADAKGQHRSWYVDELDWIKSREVAVDEVTSDTEATSQSSSAPALVVKPKLTYLVVPDDPAFANSACSICQEKFETKWLDEAQEFVWMDAVKINDKIYHASCFAEVKKDGAAAPSTAPAETVLGKRKAEADESPSSNTKIKVEP